MSIQQQSMVYVSTVATKELVNAIKTAISVTAKRPSSPILECVSLQFQTGKVTIRATNPETYFEQTLEIDSQDSFTIIVHRDVLKAIKAKTPITFTASHVTFAGITTPIRFSSDDYTLYTKFPNIDAKRSQTVTVPTEYFTSLSHAAVSAATSEIRPVLQGICHRGNSITSTDGLRLYTAPTVEFPQIFNLPAVNATLLQKVFNAHTTLTYDDRYAQYTDGKTIVTYRLIDGAYPDTSRLIPQTFKTIVTVNRQSLLYACKSAASLHGKKSNYFTTVTITKDSLTVASTNKDNGAAVEYAMDAKLKGDTLQFHCNALYLYDALAQIHGDTVHLSLNGATQPITVTSDNDSALALVSPMLSR